MGPSLNVSDPQKWLELVVAVDHTVITFHGEDEVEKYVFTLFNIVSTGVVMSGITPVARGSSGGAGASLWCSHTRGWSYRTPLSPHVL